MARGLHARWDLAGQAVSSVCFPLKQAKLFLNQVTRAAVRGGAASEVSPLHGPPMSVTKGH